MRGPSSTEIAIEAFASSYSRVTGHPCEIEPWPGGGEESHDADATLSILSHPTKLRVLLEVTEVFQEPTTRHGSLSERFLRTLRTLERAIAGVLPRDCSPTIYWRESVRGVLARPAHDRTRRELTTNLLHAVTDQCQAARLAGSALVVDDEVPLALRPWIQTIATVRARAPQVHFRYPLQTNEGITHYSGVPLTSVGVGPRDVDAATANKLGVLLTYRKRANLHHADQVWLLLLASGQSAASILSPLTFLGKIPDALPSLSIEPQFDAIYLLARGTWARAADPFGPPDEWLLVTLRAGPLV